MFFYFLNPNFSQTILNGHNPVKAAKGKSIGGNQCTQLMLSKPAKQLAIKITTPTDRNVILADGDASPKLKIFMFFVFFCYYIIFCFFESVLTNDIQFTNVYLIPFSTGVTLCNNLELKIYNVPILFSIGIISPLMFLISNTPPL